MADLAAERAEWSETAAVLREHLPWSPLDFIRGLSRDGDRALTVEQWSRPLDETDDLRFVCRCADNLDVAVFAERLPWDSDFFGYGVARLHAVWPLRPPLHRPAADLGAAVRALGDLARRKEIRYLMAVVDARDLALIRALGGAGFALIESRLYYFRSLTDLPSEPRFDCRPAVAADVRPLARTAREMVNPYDRFHADPFLDPDAVGRLMERWVEASVLEGFADFALIPAARPAAFITGKYHRDKWPRWGLRVGQPVFGAVGPECRGWYLKILSEINHHLKSVGAEATFAISQVTNRAVLRSWEKLGYSYGKTEHIFRAIL